MDANGNVDWMGKCELRGGRSEEGGGRREEGARVNMADRLHTTAKEENSSAQWPLPPRSLYAVALLSTLDGEKVRYAASKKGV